MIERCGGNKKLLADAQTMLADSRRKIDYIRMQQLRLCNMKSGVQDVDGKLFTAGRLTCASLYPRSLLLGKHGVKGRSHCVRSHYDIVRPRTTSYDVLRRRTTTYVLCMRSRSNRTRAKYRRHSHYTRDVVRRRTYKSAQNCVSRRTTSRVVWMPPILCSCLIRTTTFIRRRTTSYVVLRPRTTSCAVWTPQLRKNLPVKHNISDIHRESKEGRHCSILVHIFTKCSRILNVLLLSLYSL